MSTQTDISWPLLSNCAPISHDHNYAFELNKSPNNSTEYILTMEERLQVQTEMVDNLQKKVGNLQQELEHGCHRSGNSQGKKNSSRSGKSQGISL